MSFLPPKESSVPMTVSSPVDILRDERDAMLRALAGRLAHETRNPLAAVRAACSSLLEEMTVPDHRYRLELTLGEIDRALEAVSRAVRAVSAPVEPALEASPEQLLQDAVDAARILHPQARIEFDPGPAGPDCELPRAALRAAVLGLLDHLVGQSVDGHVTLRVQRSSDALRIHAGPVPADADTAPGTDALAMVVAERFVRDTGGRLHQNDTNGLRHVVLEIPCRHV